ncbi:MAG: hypothetical protein JRE40_07290 [Deltaproteobacteria bacterium]|nr:hypothetical protein [Deltaproteobacteria bacterium]
MGMREEPVEENMHGKLRQYKCRLCGVVFKEYYLPEDKRICASCLEKVAKKE